MHRPELRDETQGRWPAIYDHYGFDERFINQKHMPCPLCGGKDRFRFFDNEHGGVICNQCGAKDGIEFLMQHTGTDFKSLAEDIRGIIGTVQMPKTDNKQDIERARRALNGVWQGAKKIGDCPVERYLMARKVALPSSSDIRYHPALSYFDDDQKHCGEHPAMVSLVRSPEGDKATIHRTYLAIGSVGKAPLEKPKKVMTPVKSWQGGFVRMHDKPRGNQLVIGEGIETTLAYMKLTGIPNGWASVYAGNMSKLRPPEGVIVHIAGDNDGKKSDKDATFAGQKAAFMLASCLSRTHEVYVDIPDEPGDWADVVAQGKAA